MSAYAVVLRAVLDNPGKTAAELAALIPMEVQPVTQALEMLAADGRVAGSGEGDATTYTAAAGEA